MNRMMSIENLSILLNLIPISFLDVNIVMLLTFTYESAYGKIRRFSRPFPHIDWIAYPTCLYPAFQCNFGVNLSSYEG